MLSSVILTFALAFLSGCSGLVSANGTNPQLHASIQVNPANVNFGSATVGQKVAQNVSIANTGNMAVNISQANISNNQFSVSGLAERRSVYSDQLRVGRHSQLHRYDFAERYDVLLRDHGSGFQRL